MNATASSPHRFDICVRLGLGGMGEVHLARMNTGPTSVLVALKRIRVELRDQPEMARQFERETKIIARLSHPNIVRLIASGIDHEGPYLAMEYVEGRTASTLIRALSRSGQPLSLQVALSVALDVSRGLLHAHQMRRRGRDGAGVIHRDVSPDNILVGFDGRAKLTDFGVAKLVEGTTLTKAGTLKGKHGFLAPELLQGAPADALTDIFAFGVTLYELLCGVRPFRGNTDGELVLAVMSAQPAAPGTLRRELSSELDSLVQRCLSKDPRQRPELSEVVSVLEAELAKLSLSPMAAVADLMETMFGADRSPQQQTFERSDRMTVRGRATVELAWWRKRRGWTLALPLVVLGALAVGIYSLDGQATPEKVAEEEKLLQTAMSMPALPEETASSDALKTAFPEGIAASSDAIKPAFTEEIAAPSTKPKPAFRTKVADSPNAPKSHRRRPEVRLGTLRIKVRPWGQVFLDGMLLGVSPLAPVRVPLGWHTVMVVNEKLDQRKSYQIEVKPGGATLPVFLDSNER